MSMVRINNSIRSHVINALLAKKYVKDDLAAEALSQKYDELSKECEKLAYEAAFDAPLRKMLLSAAPGLFPMAHNVNVRIEQGDASNYYDTSMGFGDNKPVPFRNSTYGGRSFAAVLTNASPYVIAKKAMDEVAEEIHRASSELRDKKHADSHRISIIIDSVTTVKRLQEIWPEVIDYLPENVSGTDGQLPVEMIQTLNADFGLSK